MPRSPSNGLKKPAKRTFSSNVYYIHRLRTKVAPGMGNGGGADKILDQLLDIACRAIINKALRIMRQHRPKIHTLTKREIFSAALMMFSEETSVPMVVQAQQHAKDRAKRAKQESRSKKPTSPTKPVSPVAPDPSESSSSEIDIISVDELDAFSE